MTAPLRVTVAMLTYLRPTDLAVGVPLLIEQLDEVTGTEVTASLLVIDNDAAGTGHTVISTFDHPRVRSVVEPTPGIAAARNRALDEAADADVLVFIDDDERPHPGWLGLLLDTFRRTGAAAVAGAVVSEFDGELDPWVAAGAFFSRRRLTTDTPIDVAATNNLLLDLREVRRLGLRFDAGFGLSGAEDTLFTRSLAKAGAPMVWCNEAVVTDFVPAARMTRSWVLRRAFSSGNSWALVTIQLAAPGSGRLQARIRGLVKGAPRVLLGAGRYGVGLVTRSAHHQTRGLRSLARGAGMVAGAFSLVYQEYGRDSKRRLTRFRLAAPAGLSAAPVKETSSS